MTVIRNRRSSGAGCGDSRGLRLRGVPFDRNWLLPSGCAQCAWQGRLACEKGVEQAHLMQCGVPFRVGPGRIADDPIGEHVPSSATQKPPEHSVPGALTGGADGTRTRDVLDHNQVLYQLNYSHHRCASHATKGTLAKNASHAKSRRIRGKWHPARH